MNKLKRMHFWTGFIGIVVFLFTGQYMYHVYDHLKGLPDGTRMIFRSGHIYLLLASIINLIIGVYLTWPEEKHKIVIQYIASTIVLISPFLLLIGFFTEAHLQDLNRPYSSAGLLALFGSSILFTYIGMSDK